MYKQSRHLIVSPWAFDLWRVYVLDPRLWSYLPNDVPWLRNSELDDLAAQQVLRVFRILILQPHGLKPWTVDAILKYGKRP